MVDMDSNRLAGRQSKRYTIIRDTVELYGQANDLRYNIGALRIACILYHYVGGPFIRLKIVDKTGLSPTSL